MITVLPNKIRYETNQLCDKMEQGQIRYTIVKLLELFFTSASVVLLINVMTKGMRNQEKEIKSKLRKS